MEDLWEYSHMNFVKKNEDEGYSFILIYSKSVE